MGMTSGKSPSCEGVRRIALIAFTRRGCELARRVAAQLAVSKEYPEATCEVSGPAKFAGDFGIAAYESLGAWTADAFASCDALVYVGATGIAVRAIAPHVRDKFSDPAVVSVDEAGRFAVPLLSGHVGGANELAREVARICGGQAVVSTATDVNSLFAVDEWAARRGFAIVERVLAKEVSARLLEGGQVGFATDFELGWEPPSGVRFCGRASEADGSCARRLADEEGAPSAGDGEALAGQAEGMGGVDSQGSSCERPDLGFAVSLDGACKPFERTLHLVPRLVTVGVGCRRDTDPAVLERAVDDALRAARISPQAVRELASIDVKQDEPAILELARKRAWSLRFYTAEELAAVPGDFEASEFVKRTVGVDNVCERSALAQGGTLVLGKRPANGTTVALAVAGIDERR